MRAIIITFFTFVPQSQSKYVLHWCWSDARRKRRNRKSTESTNEFSFESFSLSSFNVDKKNLFRFLHLIFSLLLIFTRAKFMHGIYFWNTFKGMVVPFPSEKDVKKEFLKTHVKFTVWHTQPREQRQTTKQYIKYNTLHVFYHQNSSDFVSICVCVVVL